MTELTDLLRKCILVVYLIKERRFTRQLVTFANIDAGLVNVTQSYIEQVRWRPLWSVFVEVLVFDVCVESLEEALHAELVRNKRTEVRLHRTLHDVINISVVVRVDGECVRWTNEMLEIRNL